MYTKDEGEDVIKP